MLFEQDLTAAALLVLAVLPSRPERLKVLLQICLGRILPWGRCWPRAQVLPAHSFNAVGFTANSEGLAFQQSVGSYKVTVSSGSNTADYSLSGSTQPFITVAAFTPLVVNVPRKKGWIGQ